MEVPPPVDVHVVADVDLDHLDRQPLSPRARGSVRGSRCGTCDPGPPCRPGHGSRRTAGTADATRRSLRRSTCPSAAAAEREQRLLDGGQHGVHPGHVAQPGEVEADDVVAVGAAEPESVGGDGADLGDLEQGGVRRRQRAQPLDRHQRAGPRDEVLALELLAAARRELQAEVRQPLVPRPADATLRG